MFVFQFVVSAKERGDEGGLALAFGRVLESLRHIAKTMSEHSPDAYHPSTGVADGRTDDRLGKIIAPTPFSITQLVVLRFPPSTNRKDMVNSNA